MKEADNIPLYLKVVEDVEIKAHKHLELEGVDRNQSGYCHAFWVVKKAILKEQYGITWRDPVEMNPGVMFD